MMLAWTFSIHPAILSAMDFALGWSLELPRDVTLVLLVLATISLTVIARRFFTDQDRLRRCRHDLKRLSELIRQAKQSGDQQERHRLVQTDLQVRWIQFMADLRVLLVVIVPIGGLVIWASERIAYLPLVVGEPIEFRLSTPSASLERRAHLVPADELSTNSGWVAWVVSDPDDADRGRAVWQFQVDQIPREQPLILEVCHAGERAWHPLRVGDGRYEPLNQRHDSKAILETLVVLEEYRFLGLIPGWPQIGLAPWMVSYLIGCIVLTPLGKRLCGVA
ncbi:MAG: hypothetical protein U1A77_19770 [Pirellulales bacterium]